MAGESASWLGNPAATGCRRRVGLGKIGEGSTIGLHCLTAAQVALSVRKGYLERSCGLSMRSEPPSSPAIRKDQIRPRLRTRR